MKVKIILTITGICLLGIFSFLPLFHAGFFAFHDNTQVARVYEMSKSLSSGIFPVRWVGDLGYGYGYPIFNFYGPLPYYVGGIIGLAGTDALVSTKIMMLVGIILSSITMYFFSKKFFGEISGVVSAILYVYFPYHAVNIYVRGAVGEYFAYAFLPLLFLGLFQLVDISGKKIRSKEFIFLISLLSISLFLIAISHNLTFFMTLILMVPFVILGIFLAKSKKFFTTVFISGLILGVLLSAFYVLPAFLEMKFTNVSSQVGGGADFKDHFVCLAQYWSSPWGFGGSTKDCLDGLSFALGKINIAVLLFAVIAFLLGLRSKKALQSQKIVLISILLLAISFFLTLSVSISFWQSIPLMPFIQYPWRFINFIGLFVSFLGGYLVYNIGKNFEKKFGILAAVLIIFFTVVLNAKFFVPQNYNSYTSSYYTNPSYLKFTVSKISDEYMPPSFSKPKNIQNIPNNELELVKGDADFTSLKSNITYFSTYYHSTTDSVIHINRAFFPAWKAFIDSREVPLVATHNGMNVSLPQGDRLFELKFVQTNAEIIGNILTVLALIFIIVLVGWHRRFGFDV